MVVNTLIHSLMETGFTEYESKAYIALLRESPLTAYEIARRAGIPTSKVYGVVTRLAERGIFSVRGEGRRKSYVPIDTEEFLDGLKGRIQNTLTQIEGGITSISAGTAFSHVHNLGGNDLIVDKARRMISGTRSNLLVSLWKEEMKTLRAALKEAEERNIKAAVVHFGTPASKAGSLFHHPTDGRENGARSLVLVSDSQEALTATFFPDGIAEGATSTNRGFVSLAEEYIRHDIYFMKLTRRFDRDFKRVFGHGYEKLRDVFADEAHH